MVKKNVNDLTDAFDVRLQAMQRSSAPACEVDAAIKVYERMRTAKSVCQALLPDSFTEASVVALAVELGREAQLSQGTNSDE